MSLLSPSRIKAKVIKTFSWTHIRAKIEPQLHWRVPFEAGVYANSPKWSNKGTPFDDLLPPIYLLIIFNNLTDLDPVPIEMRTWKPTDYWAYWCSDMLAPPLASTVSSVMSLGFTARQTIPIVFFGFCICSVVITLTGRVSHYIMSRPMEISLKQARRWVQRIISHILSSLEACSVCLEVIRLSVSEPSSPQCKLQMVHH